MLTVPLIRTRNSCTFSYMDFAKDGYAEVRIGTTVLIAVGVYRVPSEDPCKINAHEDDFEARRFIREKTYV